MSSAVQPMKVPIQDLEAVAIGQLETMLCGVSHPRLRSAGTVALSHIPQTLVRPFPCAAANLHDLAAHIFEQLMISKDLMSDPTLLDTAISECMQRWRTSAFGLTWTVSSACRSNWDSTVCSRHVVELPTRREQVRRRSAPQQWLPLPVESFKRGLCRRFPACLKTPPSSSCGLRAAWSDTSPHVQALSRTPPRRPAVVTTNGHIAGCTTCARSDLSTTHSWSACCRRTRTGSLLPATVPIGPGRPELESGRTDTGSGI
jgi:hypothetical protein